MSLWFLITTSIIKTQSYILLTCINVTIFLYVICIKHNYWNNYLNIYSLYLSAQDINAINLWPVLQWEYCSLYSSLGSEMIMVKICVMSFFCHQHHCKEYIIIPSTFVWIAVDSGVPDPMTEVGSLCVSLRRRWEL